MAASSGGDILSAMPLWVQVVANFGMFVVAVIAAAFGFFRKHAPQLLPIEHFAEGGALASFGDDVRSIAKSMKGMLEIMRDHERQENIEREVQRRLAEERKSRA